MQSNNRKQVLNSLTSGVVGVLVGLAGAALFATAPPAGGSAESSSLTVEAQGRGGHQDNGLTVTLNFGEGLSMTAPGQGNAQPSIRVQDRTGMPRNPVQEGSASTPPTIQVGIGHGNSGCVVVGGVPYCW